MIYHFRFVGSAHLSELLSSAMESNHCIIEDAISRKLYGRSPLMIVQDGSVHVQFHFSEYNYIIHVTIERSGKVSIDEESLEAHIESLISEALRELFGDGISSF